MTKLGEAAADLTAARSPGPGRAASAAAGLLGAAAASGAFMATKGEAWQSTLAVFAVGVVTACCLYGVRQLLAERAALAGERARLSEGLKAALQSGENAVGKFAGEARERRRLEQEMKRVREEAAQAIRVKSEFLANMSHEIRTPMNGVLGMTELLLNTDLNRKQHHFAETIHRCGENLLAIINDILDFSKIEAGKLQLHEAVFDLRQLIEDVGDLFAECAHRKNLEITSAFPADLHSVFRGDVYRLQQVLTNLVGNALKFTDRGEVVMRVQTLSQDMDCAVLRIEVSDTGIGIRREALPRMFEAFSQADASTTRQYGGTGLGLAICRQIVRLMGGEIGVDSVQGVGSTFWFSLRLPKAEQAIESKRHAPAVSLHGLRALIVDDNATSREVLQQQLRAWGMVAEVAADGGSALAQLRSAVKAGNPFDVTIFDHSMPGMGGVELLRAVKASRDIADVRLIMLTAVGNLEESGQWLAAGIDGYLDKPVRQLELQKCLARVLGRLERAAVVAGPVADGAAAAAFKAHVLVAEDNAVNQELAVAVLESLGCRVRVVASGREAVEAVTASPLDLRRDPYDLVLMDCQMPEMDGYAATGAVRRWENTDRAVRRLPIIALTANALEGDRERCLAAGMDDYLTKPFTQAQIIDVLTRWLPLPATVPSPAPTPARVAGINPAANPAVDNEEDFMAKATLDEGAIDRIRALQRPGGADILAKVIGLFLENSPHLVSGMREAVATGDAGKLRSCAHALKSSSANLGATTLMKLCRDLEERGREARLDGAAAGVDVLEFEFQAACRTLREMLTRRAA